VKITKFRPLTACLNRLTAVYIARSSRSYVLYFRCAVVRDFVRKPNGCQESFIICCNTAPIAKFDASTARLIGTPGTGCANIVAFARARFDSREASSDRTDHSMSALLFFNPFRRSLSGCSVSAALGIKRRRKLIIPRYLRSYFTSPGFGAFTIASTREAIGFIPSIVIYPALIV
jgi:hypothetical protein